MERGGRGGLPAVGWSVVAAERSGKVSLEVKNSRGTRGPARRRGARGSQAGAGTLLGREGADPGLLGGDRPTKDPWGRPPPRASPPPVPAPAGAPDLALQGQLSPAIAGLGDPHLATRLRSRCCREWPCPTAPSSPARPPRECDIPSPLSSLGAAATPSRWSFSTPPRPGS